MTLGMIYSIIGGASFGALLIDESVPLPAVRCCPYEQVSVWKDSTGGNFCRSVLTEKP